MATTTNFGWETPDDTDLVKDGAAAIRTALGGVDTSFVDLKGGTTGQVLAKASGTDLDFSWVAVDPLTILDAKGDLITATAADTPARLAVGATNGMTLQVDSTTATGLKWATPTATAPEAFWAEVASTQSFSASTDTKVTFGTEILDSDSWFASSRFTPQKAGYYVITANITISGGGTGRNLIKIFKNGSVAYVTNDYTTTANEISSGTNLLYFNGSSDYAEIYVYSTRSSPASEPNYIGGFQGYFLRA